MSPFSRALLCALWLAVIYEVGLFWAVRGPSSPCVLCRAVSKSHLPMPCPSQASLPALPYVSPFAGTGPRQAHGEVAASAGLIEHVLVELHPPALAFDP